MTSIQIDKKVGFLMAGSLVVGIILGAALSILCGIHNHGYRYGPKMMDRWDTQGYFQKNVPAQGYGPGMMASGTGATE